MKNLMPSKFGGGAQQLPQRDLRRRNNGGSSSNGNGRIGSFLRKSSQPTLWIGASMFCLVIVYVGIVISVTRMHMTSDSDNGSGSSIGNGMGNEIGSEVSVVMKDILNDGSSSSLKNRLNDVKEKRGNEKKKNKKETQEEKDRRNPFRKNRDMDTFGLGVKPAVIIPHNDGDSPAAIQETAASVKDHRTPEYVLKAYLEPLNFDEWETQPLPLRAKAQANLLKEVAYPRLNSCSKLTQQFPVDDTPTDQDPFLPWIHDVFPTADGKFIQFVAQNKRRCHTGKHELDIIRFMAPQAALFQHVHVKRVPDPDNMNNNDIDSHNDLISRNSSRYKISDSHEDADLDGMTTRFICRFKPSMEETLSVYNFDYDWTAYRKRYKASFTKDDGNVYSIHTSQLIFRCPVPASLQETIRQGSSVKDDWASLFVDLIPIRTPPRFGVPHMYFPPWHREFETTEPTERFYPNVTWGSNHLLPKIQDSGRWENIPICMPSLLQYEDQTVEDLPAIVVNADDADAPQPLQKKHNLVSCIWASAGYTTRGERFAVNDGQRRMLEWITYNKLIGFDHIYVYDNSGAFSNSSSLKPIADLFPGEVTLINWPSQICNNHPNNVDSPGDRSSQYAAESSCRLRFGPHVNWIGQFDIDEYLIPMGNHDTVLSLLDELDKEDTRIISFGSWRAWPRWDFIEEPVPIKDPDICWSNEPCFHLQIPVNHTMLQAYNCDRQPPGKKTQSMPAEKQIYRADYVLQHFVHYSAVTALSEKNTTEYAKEGFKWKRRGFPDARQRFADEVTEGLMIHTKAVAQQDTAGWQRMCSIHNLYRPKRQQGLCRLGVPWPKDPELAKLNATAGGKGAAFNCFVNDKVEDFLVPKLNENLAERLHFFDIK